MSRYKYFLENKLNSVTGWKSERVIVSRKAKGYKREITISDYEEIDEDYEQ